MFFLQAQGFAKRWNANHFLLGVGVDTSAGIPASFQVLSNQAF